MTLPGGLDQSDVVAWYAARLDAGASDGQPVPQLIDVSGNGKNATALNSSRRFTYNAALTAWEANIDCYKRAWGLTVTEPFTIFSVVKITGPMNTDYCIHSGHTKPQKHMTGIYNGNHQFVMEQEGTGQHIYGGSPQSNQLYVLRSEYADIDRLYVNGALEIEGDAGNDASIGATIGCRENDQRHVIGLFYEYGFALGTGLTAVETDLRSIYGV